MTERRIPLEISLPVSLVNHLERLEEQLEIKSKSFVIQMLLQEVFEGVLENQGADEGRRAALLGEGRKVQCHP